MCNAERYVTVKPKACEKGYREYQAQRGDMWRHHHDAEVYKLLTDNVVIKNKVPQGVEHHIRTSADAITKDIARYNLANLRYIEQVNAPY
jgi:hypothetical protein